MKNTGKVPAKIPAFLSKPELPELLLKYPEKTGTFLKILIIHGNLSAQTFFTSTEISIPRRLSYYLSISVEHFFCKFSSNSYFQNSNGNYRYVPAYRKTVCVDSKYCKYGIFMSIDSF